MALSKGSPLAVMSLFLCNVRLIPRIITIKSKTANSSNMIFSLSVGTRQRQSWSLEALAGHLWCGQAMYFTTSAIGSFIGRHRLPHSQCPASNVGREWVVPPILHLTYLYASTTEQAWWRVVGMNTAGTLPLYWTVCLINGGVFAGATAVLVVTPATVSSEVTPRELVVLTAGLAVILLANAILVRRTLAPLDRLNRLMEQFDPRRPENRLPEQGSGVAANLARSFNTLLSRLEAERATSNVRALAAQEAERQRIAQELHDEVGQRLTVVLLGVSRILDKAPTGLTEELTLIRDNARSSLDEVRRVARGLRPGVLEDLGLVSALAAMANEFTSPAGIQIRRCLERGLPPVAPEVELVIFRVAQEALTNVTRHAEADTVELSLTKGPKTIRLLVSDNGRGIRGAEIREGIRGMRERALFVGGQLTIGPCRGSGTEVRLDVPLERALR